MTARVVIAGTHSGVGKTTVATGLLAAFAARGVRVTGAKIGPDFIDPSYHALASGRPGRNLDVHLSGEDLVAPLFAHGAAGAELAIVEGVMGLFDGMRSSGGVASTAHVARLLDAPVVLVVDGTGMSDSVAALVGGFRAYDRRIRIGGVVLNRVGSVPHGQALIEALARIDVPVLGVLRREADLDTPSRHLGLVPVAERPAAAARTLAAMGSRVAAAVDLDAVRRLAVSAPPLRATAWRPPEAENLPAAARIAVAGGPAFSFVYAENLELLRAAGAELAELDPTVDDALPARTDALYLGGGFPEAHAQALSANAPLRRAVLRHAAAGRPVLAECGGLLYLCESLDGLPMCGVLPARASMGARLYLGYRTATTATATVVFPAGSRLTGHEFHRSTILPGAGVAAAWDLESSVPRPEAGGVGWGRDAVDAGPTRREGFVRAGVHASYLHTHWAATPQVAARFVAAARAGSRTAVPA